MRDHVQAIWNDLMRSPAASSGLVRRRYDALLDAELYLAVAYPDMTRMLMLRLPLGVLRSLSSSFLQLRGVRMQMRVDAATDEMGFVALLLVEPALGDLFDVLVADLGEALREVRRPETQGRILLARLTHWRSMFAAYRGEELSVEARMGLYGELCWLGTLLGAGLTPRHAVGSWQGSPGGDQDFVSGSVAAEIKTTVGHRAFRVGSERQLDESSFQVLMVVQQVISSGPDGTTLPAEIERLRSIIRSDEQAADRYEARLTQIGYSDAHAHHYEDVRYVHESSIVYRIGEGFPRLSPPLLPAGIGSVSYSVDPSACRPFIIPVADAVKYFRVNDE